MGFGNGSATPRSIGVEEELLLVDARSWRPTAVVEWVLEASARMTGPIPLPAADAPPPTHLTREAKQEQVEIVSSPSTTLEGVAGALATGRSLADRAAQSVGARAVALGTSLLPAATHVARGDRYAEMEQRFGLTMREQLTCGLHVHVAVADDEEGVAVLDRIRSWLPVLLALSSNSPIWKGRDSGYASYRHQAMGRWPSSGPTEIFGSAAAYHRAIDDMVASDVLLDGGMVYLDARLSERYPTVEIRVADACTELEHAVAIAGLARALVQTAADEWRRGSPPAPVSTTQLRLAMWTASRFGTGGNLLDPRLAMPIPAGSAIEMLLAHVGDALNAAGDLDRVSRAVDDILRAGTGADRQRLTLQRTERAAAVVADAAERTNRPTGARI